MEFANYNFSCFVCQCIFCGKRYIISPFPWFRTKKFCWMAQGALVSDWREKMIKIGKGRKQDQFWGIINTDVWAITLTMPKSIVLIGFYKKIMHLLFSLHPSETSIIISGYPYTRWTGHCWSAAIKWYFQIAKSFNH